MSAYNTAGGTISEKSVAEEYLLSLSQLSDGVEIRKLTVQNRSFHGNSYRLYIRSEVEAYARLVGPDPYLKSLQNVKMAKQNLSAKRARFDAVSSELANIDNKKLASTREKDSLHQWLMLNDPKAAAAAVKAATAAAKAAVATEKKAAAEAKKLAAETKKAATAAKKRKVTPDE